MKDNRKAYKVYAIVSTFVFEVILVVGVFVTIGYLLDQWLNTFIFIILFSLGGVFAGIYNLIRKVNRVK